MSQARPLPATLPQEGTERRWAAWIASRAGQRYWTAVALVASVAAVFFVHLPVLGHYFFGDDFVPLADISLRSTPGYVKDLFLLQDVTPNWRFLTGLYYLGAYRTFGLSALPYFLIAVLVHTGTAALLFCFVRRATERAWPAFLAAALFGLTAAHAPTVGQVTAFNNVLAGFFLMLALVLLYEGLVREQTPAFVAASALSFALAIGANESTMAIAPVFALVAAWKIGWPSDARAWTRLALIAAPYLVMGGAALVSFAACGCSGPSRDEIWGGGGHIFGNLMIYLGRLLYPIGLEAPGDPGAAHLAAGSVVIAVALAALALGPALARIAVVFLALALAPYLPLQWALAGRYVYMAAIPFSILAALFFAEAARYASRVAPAAALAVGALALGALALHGWQSVEQNASFKAETDDWRALVSALEERYPDLPAASKVYVRGGPLALPLLQFNVLPAVGEVLWGGVIVAAVPEETQEFCDTPGGDIYVLDYDGGAFTAVPGAPVIHCPAPE